MKIEKTASREYEVMQSLQQEGRLQRDLPEFGLFAGAIALLKPTYERMQKKDWSPVVTFVPEDLSLEDGDYLIGGRTLPDGSTASGISGKVDRYWARNTDPTQSFTRANEASTVTGVVPGWDIAVISGRNEPVFRNVGNDGFSGKNAKEYIRQARKLIIGNSEGLEELTTEVLVAIASPSFATYAVLQARNLAMNLQPVDSSKSGLVRTNLKERTVDPKYQSPLTKSVLVGHWSSKRAALHLNSAKLGPASQNPHSGFRPAIRSKDLKR